MSENTNKRRKVLAILAGGLVLGVGTALTLAAWNDSEFATGDFAAGSFNLEGTTDFENVDFTDNDSAPGASLEFTLPLADNLAPDDTVYAGFWVRLDADTTSPAELETASIAGDGVNAEHLSYTVHVIDDEATCDADSATGSPFASGADLEDLTAGAPEGLSVGAEGDPGEAVQLCFAVTAEDGLEQGETATATWQFTATSQ